MTCQSKQSLRFQIEKWLAPSSMQFVQVTKFSRTPSGKRYVSVEAPGPLGSHTLFFFRHDDGSWTVLPPEPTTPKKTVNRIAA
jgi:hypothetical protein